MLRDGRVEARLAIFAWDLKLGRTPAGITQALGSHYRFQISMISKLLVCFVVQASLLVLIHFRTTYAGRNRVFFTSPSDANKITNSALASAGSRDLVR